VLETRGQGFFLGIELAQGHQHAVLAAARSRGLLLYPFNGFRPGGTGEGVIIAPPLNVSDAEVEFLADALRSGLADAARQHVRTSSKEKS
jgi:adenosylmethionine-8-amino-7-oxononanoate aminotransferase